MSSKFFGNRTEKHSIKKRELNRNLTTKVTRPNQGVLEKLEEEDNILNHS